MAKVSRSGDGRCHRSAGDRSDQAAEGPLLPAPGHQGLAGLAEPLPDDFLSDTSPAGGKVIKGADEFVAFTRKSLRSQATVHQVHAPEIELTSPTTARGVWALEDVVRFGPGVNLRGYGHYTETYEKADGQWLITSSTLTRLREDVFNAFVSVYISDRIRRVIGKAARRVMK